MTSELLLRPRELDPLKKQRLVVMKYSKDGPDCQLFWASDFYVGQNRRVDLLEFDPCPLVTAALAGME